MIVGMMVASFDVLVININVIFVWHIDNTSQKFLNSKIFYVFFKEFSSAQQACIYLIHKQ